MPVRPCIVPRCPLYAEPGKSRCAEHEAEHERQRKTPSQKVTNTHRWRKLRRQIIDSTPRPWWCAICGLLITDETDLELDHRTPVSEGGEPYDPTNVRMTHARCNRSRRAPRRQPWRGRQTHLPPWMRED